MFVFAVPALVALATKLWIYILARNNTHTPRTFLWLLIFFAVHNLCEFLIISKFFNNDISEALLRTYYVAVIFALAYICIFVLSVASENNHNKLNAVTLGVAFLMSCVIYLTNWIVAGAISADYTVTAIKGSYYFVFQISIVLGLAWILFILCKRYINNSDINIQLKCFYTAFALSPIILMSICIIIMMQMGYPYTAAILLPFSSTLFLFLVVLTEKHHDLIQIRHKLPFSNQRAAERKILSLYRSLADGDEGFVKTKNDIEKILIEGALERSNNNVSLAADQLGIKRSSLYSIFNRLNIRKN